MLGGGYTCKDTTCQAQRLSMAQQPCALAWCQVAQPHRCQLQLACCSLKLAALRRQAREAAVS